MKSLFGFPQHKIPTLVHLILSSGVKSYGPTMATKLPSF